MPKMRSEIKWNDVIRFGRVTFKVTELVITPEQILKAQLMLEQLQNGIFRVQQNQAQQD